MDALFCNPSHGNLIFFHIPRGPLPPDGVDSNVAVCTKGDTSYESSRSRERSQSRFNA